VDPDRNRPNFFAGPYLDRRAELREAAEWLAAARDDSSTLYVISRGTTQLLLSQPEPHIAFVPGDHPLVRAADESQLVLLGWFRGMRSVLVDLGPASAQDDEPELLPGARFEELRPLTNNLPAEEGGLLAYARAMAIWRARHRFCGVCASPLVPERAGHVMRCLKCGQESFPRIDPAIIVLVADGDRALLGRAASWPLGRYSTIAGFVEPGESLEDAVAREVLEETAVRVRSVNYHSSQPWPFPSSLIGFHATADSNQPVQVSGELEHALVHSRRASSRATSAAVDPSPYRLITTWLRRLGRQRRGRRLTHVPARARMARPSALQAHPGGKSRRISRAGRGAACQMARPQPHSGRA
jgi:NAD+ diphosphatase